MTDHTARLYAFALSVLVFVVAWATAAAHPWGTTTAAKPDPRVAALAAKERRVRAEALAVRRVLSRRRQQAAAAASAPVAAPPPVRIVTLPPLTITRTS
jgi:hypothetical protein